MAYDLIPILVLLVSVTAVLLIMGRRLPQARSVDVASIPAERELRLKQRLLAERLRRRLQGFGRWLSAACRPVISVLLQWVKRGYRRVLDLELHYQRPKPEVAPSGDLTSTLSALVQDGNRLRSVGDFAAAEDHLIKAIGLDQHHVAAYEMLGDLYLETKEFAKAREVFTYLVKLLRRGASRLAAVQPKEAGQAQRLAASYQNLAMVYQELGQLAQAQQFARKAVATDADNPRMLDFLLKISILVKDRTLADKTWQALKTADPNNAKLQDLRQQIDEFR
ncbi:MAG: tetratricopeptide repeat protein [bacterium]|nr:tetratricopeptide repeat protein [bacterium]